MSDPVASHFPSGENMQRPTVLFRVQARAPDSTSKTRIGPGYLACFSADGATAVLSTGQGPFRLVEVATGRELARFEDPDWDVEQVAMSPDGGTLVARHKAGLRVWDLRLIRAGLARLGLDWDAPALPPRKEPEGPLRVKIVGADLLAR